MQRFAVLGLLVLAGCAPAVTTDAFQLTPANATALRDGTPIARLTGYAGDPRATVSFIFANGDTLAGDAIMNRDVQNSFGLWGQKTQVLSDVSTVSMVAIDDRQRMACSGLFGPRATNMTCNFSDGAVYRDEYVVPMASQPAAAAHGPAK